jgi:hypothetical protein
LSSKISGCIVSAQIQSFLASQTQEGEKIYLYLYFSGQWLSDDTFLLKLTIVC